MRTVRVIAFNSFQENIRGRFLVLSLIFGGMILYLSLLLGLLAIDQELRALMDAGLASIELMALGGAVYGASTSILKEMETKTIYLVLTRPVSRGHYLLGRFSGQMISVLCSMAMMSAFHLGILFWKGWSWQALYLHALLGIFLKVLITTALATFLALFSTSVLSGLTMTSILWTLGHVLPEIRFLIAHRARHEAGVPLMLLARVIPDLQLFNLKDRLDRVSLAPPEQSVLGWLAYSILYAGVWLLLARRLLQKKEF